MLSVTAQQHPEMSMYNMSQHQYSFAPAPPAARQFTGHGTSSAFSSSANPDEDWTKISDLAERRRIQNRIAQRNYRKKLKRRLEDLERRAGSPEEGETEKQPPVVVNKNASKRRSPTKTSPKLHQPLATPPMKPLASQYTPPMDHDETAVFPSQFYERERSHSPPLFSYQHYPAPDELIVSSYGSQQQYQPISHGESYSSYMTSSTLPSLSHFSDAIPKRESYPIEGLTPYMNYGYMPSIEATGSSPYESNPHTPPLSHCFDHSANGSESGYEYPTTPMSLPGSPPNTVQHEHHL